MPDSISNRKHQGPSVPKTALAVAVVTALFGVLFLVAGRWDWLRGWGFVGIGATGQGVSLLYVRLRNPGLLSRRGRPGKGARTWDKFVLGAFGLSYVSTLVVSALDARYGWSRMGVEFWALGAALYAFFVFMVTWSMSVNPFFEKTVCIQSERGHHAIDSGPYRVVRHPGYLGSIVGFTLGTPLLLGSWWACAPALAGVACLVVRTILEDRTLRRELPGYEAYAQRVCYRLIPGIW